MRIVLGLVLASLASPGFAVTRGDLWMVVSQPSTRMVKVCTPKAWTEPPGVAEVHPGCVASEFVTEGATVTWKIACAGPPAATGAGELTRDGDDVWTGTARFDSVDGSSTEKLSARRVGVCLIGPSQGGQSPAEANRGLPDEEVP